MLKMLDKSWEGRTAWCVPTAFSFLTGATMRSSHEKFAFAQDLPLNDLKGVPLSVLLMGLKDAGYRASPAFLAARYPNHEYGPSLRRYLRERPYEECINPVLIYVTGHVVVAHMNWVADNWTKRPVPVDDFPKLDRYVGAAWTITPCRGE